MNAETGEIVETHDDNMITNALTKFFANAGWLNTSAFATSNASVINASLVERFMGGLLLFDTAQEEDVDHLIVSAGTKMIGNGSYGVVSNDTITELGSWNSDESGWNADGTVCTMVWDFSTSQANGQIACASLTSAVHGYAGEGNSTSHLSKAEKQSDYASSIAPNSKATSFDIAALFVKSNYIYGFDYADEKIILSREHCPVSEIDLRDISTVSRKEVVDSNYIDMRLPVAPLSYGVNMYTDEDYCYALIYTISSGYVMFTNELPIAFIKINKDSLEKEVLQITPAATGLDAMIGPSINVMRDMILFVSSSNEAYLVHTDNLANSEDVTNRIGTQFGHVGYCSGDRLYCDGAIFDSVLKTIEPYNGILNAQYNRFTGILEDNEILTTHNYLYNVNNPAVNRYSGYLATINNLETPVIKDSTKTMKVVYTLTFGEE